MQSSNKEFSQISVMEQLAYVADRGMGALEYRPSKELPQSASIDLSEIIAVLKDVLHETPVTIMKGDGATKPKKVEHREEEQPVKRGRKPKIAPKEEVKKKKYDTDSESDDDESDDKIEDDDSSARSESSKSDDGESSDDEKPSKKEDDTTEKKPAGGIKILNINENKTLILYVKLLSENFLEFSCKYDTFDIGLDLVQAYNYFRNIEKEGILNMYVDEDEKQKIVFQVVNAEKESDSKYKLKLMDINKKIYDVPPPEFDMVVNMKTEDFHKMCREMSNVGNHMAITCSDKKIEFKCKGSIAELEKTFYNGDNVKIMVASDDDPVEEGEEDKKGKKDKKDKKKEIKKSEPKIVREIYELRNLSLFNKCTNLCEGIQLLLKNKYPLFIRYTVTSLGEMTVGFAPADESLIGKNTNYNEENDAFYDEEDKVKMKMKD